MENSCHFSASANSDVLSLCDLSLENKYFHGCIHPVAPFSVYCKLSTVVSNETSGSYWKYFWYSSLAMPELRFHLQTLMDLSEVEDVDKRLSDVPNSDLSQVSMLIIKNLETISNDG